MATTSAAASPANTAPANSSPNPSISISSSRSCANCRRRLPINLPMSTAKILAVDDEADFELLIRQRFRRQIRSEEFAFRYAHHGEEALRVLEEEPDIGLL